jgi:mannose-6-phosphate isomerase-like protein (cupin superfamily)
MEKIYSKIKPDTLLHIINRKKDINSQRQDLSPENEHLQVACFSASKDEKLASHKHVEQIRTTGTTQESWLIIKGSIKITLHDINDEVIKEEILNQGDCLITFRGGHEYTVLEDDTVIYEYKTGPYQKTERGYIPID